MKKSRILSVSLLLSLLFWGGEAMAQCYQPTIIAAREAENSGNYQRAATLYKEAQGCYDGTSQQKAAAKAAEARCRKALEPKPSKPTEPSTTPPKKPEPKVSVSHYSSGSNEVFTVGNVTFKMVWVEGGTFTMGCTPEQGGDCWDSELPAHSVTLDGYYMGETEVTQALWTAVMGTTVRQQRDKADQSWPLSGEGNNYPMYYVSYDEAVQFTQKLSQLTGCTFSLPTEAEWEYAARGGSKSRGYKYAGSDDVDAVAWCDGNSGYQTHPVAQKAANELGLYDMSGNVHEWCSDWYGGYSSGAQRNPTGPGSGAFRVLRDDSWSTYAKSYRVSSRSLNDPTLRSFFGGFRLVFRP